MPLYTYYCKDCNINTERIVKIDVRDGQSCAECGGALVRNLDTPGMVWSPTRNNGYSF